MEKFSVIALANKLQTEADAYLFLEGMRWPDGPVCSHCGNTKAYYLAPKDGVRKTTRGTGTQRRVWKCAACRKQFTVLTGTIFHGTHISLRAWLMVFFEMCANKNGISAREVERKYDLTPKSAWFMLHRIREAMKQEPLAGMLRGVVVADEAYIGGSPKNKHQQGKPARVPNAGPGVPKRKIGRGSDKPIVLSLISRETGEVRSRVINDVTGHTLRKHIASQVDMGNATLHTDSWQPYRQLGAEFQAHETVDHNAQEYVRYADGNHISTNQAENYFSQLKRSLDGTNHHVSKVHLGRYLAEYDFRYSTRKLSDTARMRQLMARVEGRRLSYRPLKDGQDIA